MAFAICADIRNMEVRGKALRRLGIAFGIALVVHLAIAAFVRPMHRAYFRAVKPQPIIVIHLIRHHAHKHVRPVAHRRHRIHHRVPHIVMHARSHSAQGARARNIGHVHRAAHSALLLAVPRELAVEKPRPAPATAVRAGRSAVAGTGVLPGTSAGSSGGGNGGNGGGSDTGNGSGTRGSGSGDGIAPCGSIYITRRGQIKTFDGLEHVHVGIQVQLKDGTVTPEVALPYPLVYRSDADSPFSDRNRNDPNFPTLLQLPPPGTDASTFPAIITLVLAHTIPSGYTVFSACPRGSNDDGPR